jgi:hypothetical protein
MMHGSTNINSNISFTCKFFKHLFSDTECKGHDKVVTMHIMRACGKSGGMASFTFNFGTIWGRKIRFMTCLFLPLARKHPVPTNCEDGWPLS